MRICVLLAGAAVVGLSAGCQSSPWLAASDSRFDFDWLGRRSDASRSLVRDSESDGRSAAQRGGAEGVAAWSADASSSHSQFRNDRNGIVQSGYEANIPGDPNSEADSSAVAANLKRGHVAEAEGRMDQAGMFYERVLDIDPNNSLAHHRLAILADQQKDFRRSEEHYLTALRSGGDDPNLLSDLGYSFLLQNRHEESEYYLRQALRSDPSHLRALNNLGLLYARRGDYDGALAMFRLTGPEREVQEKMRELFPTGRPRSDVSMERRPHSFLNSSPPAEFTAQQRQPAPPAYGQPGPSDALPPWAEAGALAQTRTTDEGRRPPVAPSPRGDDDVFRQGGTDREDGANSARTAGGASFSMTGGSGWGADHRVPFDGRSNNTAAGGFPAETGQPGHRFGAGGNDQSPMTPGPYDAGQFRQQPKSAAPLDSLQEWPPTTPPRTDDPWGRGALSPEPLRSGDARTPGGARTPTEVWGGPASQRSNGSISQSGVQTASGVMPHSPAFGAAADGSLQGRTAEDPRRQAALLGLNAGADGVFPVIPRYDDDTSQQRLAPPPTRVQPTGAEEPARSGLPPNTQGAVIPRDSSRFASAGQSAGSGTPETGVVRSNRRGGETHRMTARPTSPSAGTFTPNRRFMGQPSTAGIPNDTYRRQVPTYHPPLESGRASSPSVDRYPGSAARQSDAVWRDYPRYPGQYAPPRSEHPADRPTSGQMLPHGGGTYQQPYANPQPYPADDYGSRPAHW